MQTKLTEKIAELKNELEQIPIENAVAREHINHLIKEIEESDNGQNTDKDFITDKIKTTIDNFETEHPRATAILNDIMVTLSNMGI